MSAPCLSSTNIISATNAWKSKKWKPIIVFYGPWYLPFLLKKNIRGIEMEIMYRLNIVFNFEHIVSLLQAQFMQLIQGNPKNRTPSLYFTKPQYWPFLLKKNIWSTEMKIMYKLRMLFKFKQIVSLVQTLFMQQSQGKPKTGTPSLYFTNPGIAHSYSGRIYEVVKWKLYTSW